jgi:hypothetical protein
MSRDIGSPPGVESVKGGSALSAGKISEQKAQQYSRYKDKTGKCPVNQKIN